VKLAVILGGWHWPSHPFRRIPRLAGGADLFVVAHRKPWEAWPEKSYLFIGGQNGDLSKIDREMYEDNLVMNDLELLDWSYQDAPNTSGDWTFFNQWLDTHDYRTYDVILNCHDDTWFRPGVNVFTESMLPLINQTWSKPPLMLANGRFPNAPSGYVRGSFEFWTRELLDMLGGRIPIPPLSLNREGLTDTPKDFEALMSWNAIGDPLRRFFVDNKLVDRIAYLSDYYRVSQWVLEGERGLISNNWAIPASFNAGLERWPIL
jgi:hypothetical protein